MKNRIPKNSLRRFDDPPPRPSLSINGVGETDLGSPRWVGRKVQQHYCSLALVMAVVTGAGLMFAGYAALGKGILLGTLFGVLNFILMGLALPMRLGKSRAKSTVLSLTSICVRYAILSIPLIWALKVDAIAVSTTAVGLFMVQIAILAEHLWRQWRNPMEAS